MKDLAAVFKESKSLSGYSKDYFEYLGQCLSQVKDEELDKVWSIISKARSNGSTIFILGNGGSASTASHFANDLNKYANLNTKKKIRAVSLTDNVSVVTAIANDLSYGDIFKSQLEVFLKKNDVVIGISASGNSENIIKAFSFAKMKGAVCIALVGFDGGKMKKMADACVHIKTGISEYGPAEDFHIIFDHVLTSYMNFRNKKK